ncbi:hypothetical protein [Alkalilimnicola sp. S0819]|uniref:hypothetical protein n=1 Tax=Alkalilimnicola sp. S0819 TaxID=2613922 RepID=UPI001262A6E9|nr:hypothetical protein [Alkalilimnicola sp. S0819]KAB7622702.1 hypothetical protein F3N43_11920 [Alkalilimnicola sp. S0819]MPQ17341.1 hypothetical protein [Alkalilimnicola sp. S0819]
MSAEQVPGWLFGEWRLREVEPGVELQEGTGMEFLAEGELVYTIPLEGRVHRFSLYYSVRGDELHTRQPEADHHQSVGFGRTESGLLEFDFAGVRAWFERV